ncbi:MAG: LOG family protein [Candidatus Omnitrophica bacterium]|nr:LOG family protein [Candidatus Omnitrophota bacterium]
MDHREKRFEQFRKDLAELMEGEVPRGTEEDIYYDFVSTAMRLRRERFDILDVKLLNTALKELQYAFKIFKPYRSIPKAAIFGSARTRPGHPNFRFAESFGKKLARQGWMVITGGASGIMEATMRGAGAENSFGLNILLPFEQKANVIIRGNPKLVYFKYFFTRKLLFLKESAATVLFPGGFGTFDEGFESFTLVQTGKAKPRPLVLVDPPKSGFWRSTIRLFRETMAEDGLIDPADLSLMRHFQDADAAVREITQFYGNYHSSRFLRDQYLIRLNKPVSPAELERLNRDFRDVLTQGGFEILKDVRLDDNQDPALSRIVFYFDRSSYGRLRQLIDALNGV